ncbi:hypothetical protein WJX74_008170 [Apatococcus lobatus]|uniref:Uncharacterized protein n=1 Tax=Apatococcus lobatus TaxID=904363 RepID=A0AAW1QZE4_9CHLO
MTDADDLLRRPENSGLTKNELERMLGNAPGIDAPSFADILLAILLFADDIALFSYSHAGCQARFLGT